MRRALLVMAKRPAPGQTKTRLSPPLSPERACRLYESFLRDTLDLARGVPGVERRIVYWPEGERAYFEQLAPDFGLQLQRGADLGERLDHALTQCLREGWRQVVVIDSDSPTLPPRYIERAFERLEHADVVLGPCEDGGYYLIGLVRPQPPLLREVEMSTSHVLRDTLALAQREHLAVALLPAWYDIDRLEGIRRLEEELRYAPARRACYTRRLIRNGWKRRSLSRR